MECNKDEAIRAREIAEQKMLKNDFEGARNIAIKARNLYPELDNISRLIAVCDVHCSSLKKINSAEKDLYGILQIEITADETTIRKQYRKLALVLHPDKNKFPGAESAFKLIGEANMTLSDKVKRSVYDAKCRQPVKVPVKVPVQKPQSHQNQYVKKPFTSQNNFNGVQNQNFQSNGGFHRQQPPPPPPSSRPSFWTYCPFCNIKYEYYIEFVNKPLRCQHCSKLFLAYDIGGQGGTVPPRPRFVPVEKQSVNHGSQPPFSHMDEVRKREKVKVNTEKVKVNTEKDRQSSSSHFTHQTQNTKSEGHEVGGSSRNVHKENGKEELTKSKGKTEQKKRGRKTVTESSESESGGGFVNNNNVNSRKSSRQKQHVSYNEDDESTPKKKPRKSSNDDVEDVKKETEKEKEKEKEKVSNENMPNGNNMNVDDGNDDNDDDDDDDEKSDADPEFVDCPDLEFSNFDQDKEEHCFKVDQMWACYDSVDGMPRFYARIRKVFTREFKLKITWLEADPDKEPEIKWAEEGLPVGCGQFVSGDTEETKDRLMFSHQIEFKNGPKRNTFFILPKKGEIWGLFKDWDINWGLDPEKHRKYKFDIVEVSDVHENGSISVALLVKVKGFVSLFQRTVWGGLADRKIPGSELYRFSHRIPSTKLTGAERAGVPPGSFELDTASLPDDLDQYYYSVKGNLDNSQNVEKSNPIPATPKKNSDPEGKNGISDKSSFNLRRSPRGLKNKDGNLPKDPPKAIHDFGLDRKIWKFHKGQIWAFWEQKNGIQVQCYGKIIKIQTDPVRLEVSLLKPINSQPKSQTNLCGLFKLSSDKTKTILPPEVFSHVVKVEESGGGFCIYPKEQQIWALKKREDDADCTCIVQVLERDESGGFKVLSLTRVPGYKSVFKGPRVQKSSDNIVVVPRREVNRFSRQIPAFLFTEEKDGELRGCWELDPVALTGLDFIGGNEGQTK